MLLRVGRQRVQRWRVLERDERGWWGGMLPSSSVFRFWMVPDGAAARRAWGVAVVQTGGFGSLVEKRGWSAGCSLRGASYGLLPFSLPGGRTPSVQHRPRVTYSGTAKGPLLGGLPIVSGLEGVCDVEEKETGLNPAACCENAWSGVKALENKARHGGEERGGTPPPFFSPRPARLGVGCKRRGGCPGERESNREGSAIPPALSPLESPVAPPCRSVVDGHKEGVCGRNGTRED